MESARYCMGCMHKLDWNGRCRYCDFEENNYKKDQQLGLHTYLKNKEYILGRQIGQGGFGITYIGMDTTLLQTVAIKEYFPLGAVKRNDKNEIELYDEKYRKDYEKGLESFLREGRILARFSNLTAVVGVKQFFHENNTAYLVMEYVEGTSVREYVNRFGALPPAQVLSMVRQVIADMQTIHYKQVLHRDISADNLIITYNGRLKLIDFGATRQEFTKNQYTGTILCKQGYSAIEQYSTGRNQGPWTDIYGLCASVYFMLTGVVPDSAPDRIQNDRVKSLVQMDEIDMPIAQKEAIMKGIAVEVEHRYRTMSALYEALYDEKLEDVSGYYERENSTSDAKKKNRNEYLEPDQKSVSRTKMEKALKDLKENREHKKKKKIGLVIAVIIACAILAFSIGQQILKKNSKNVSNKAGNQGTEKSVSGKETLPDQFDKGDKDTAQNAKSSDPKDTNTNHVTDESMDTKNSGSTAQSGKSTDAESAGSTVQNSKKASAGTKNSASDSTASNSKKASTSTKSPDSTAQNSKKASASTKSHDLTAQNSKKASTKSSNSTTQSKKKASTKSSNSTTQSKKKASTKSTSSTTQSKKSTSTKNTTKKQTTSKKANSLENIEKSSKDDSNVAGDLGE